MVPMKPCAHAHDSANQSIGCQFLINSKWSLRKRKTPTPSRLACKIVYSWWDGRNGRMDRFNYVPANETAVAYFLQPPEYYITPQAAAAAMVAEANGSNGKWVPLNYNLKSLSHFTGVLLRMLP